MTNSLIISEAEAVVRETVVRLTRVRAGECVCCYVSRQLDTFPCDGTLRLALRYRDDTAPRATALAERLGRVGGWCDCEVFLNGYTPHQRFWTPRHDVEEDGDVDEIDAEPPEPLPPCAQVRRGSVRPCANWERIRRGWY